MQIYFYIYNHLKEIYIYIYTYIYNVYIYIHIFMICVRVSVNGGTAKNDKKGCFILELPPQND